MSWLFHPTLPAAAQLTSGNKVSVSTTSFIVDWSIDHTIKIGSPETIVVDTKVFTVSPQTVNVNPAHVGLTTFTTATTQTGTSTTWTNPANARVNDGSFATVTLAAFGQSNYLQFRLSDLGIPNTAYVQDICVRVYARVSATASQSITANLVDRVSGGQNLFGNRSATFTSANTWELKTLGTLADNGDVWTLDSDRCNGTFWNAATSFLEIYAYNGSVSTRTHDIDYVEILVSYDTSNRVRVDTLPITLTENDALVYGYIGEQYSSADTTRSNNWGWGVGADWTNKSGTINKYVETYATVALSGTGSYTFYRTFGELGIPPSATLLQLEVRTMCRASSTGVWPYIGLYWKGDGSGGTYSQGGYSMNSSNGWGVQNLTYTPPGGKSSGTWNSTGWLGLFLQGTAATVDVGWVQIYVKYACDGNVIQVDTTDFNFSRGTQTTTAWTNPGTATNINWGNSYNWSNVNNILTQNDSAASVSSFVGQYSNDLRASNFGFAIPTDATIDGLDYQIDAYGAAGSSASRLIHRPYMQNDGTYGSGDDSGAWGTTMSEYGATDTDNYQRFYTNLFETRKWLDTGQYNLARKGIWFGHMYWDDVNDVYKEYTPTDINSSAFNISCWTYSGGVNGTVYVDSIQAKITYTIGDIAIIEGNSPPPTTLYTFMLLGYGT